MQRRIVVEIEHVRRVRRSARTNYTHCSGCATDADFISLDVASDLFEVTNSEMMTVLKKSNCHFHADEKEKGLICLNSLIRSMKAERKILRGRDYDC